MIFKVFLFLIFLSGKSYAQFGTSHEIGILAGPTAFFTDYGERWNVINNINNAGMGVGLVHYMHFAHENGCHYLSDHSFFSSHFRIRNEIDYFRSNLEHYGPVSTEDSDGGRLLRAMHGFSEILEAGTHLEYHFFPIRKFSNFSYLFGPYISLGAHLVRYDPRAHSDLGPLEENLFRTFQGRVDLDPGHTVSVVGVLGTRYKLTMRSDLLVETRWHYYNSDWVDGLNPDNTSNKANDWTFWLNVGYVYYLNF